MSAVDPANVRAQARAELGLSCKLAQPRGVEPHPHQGGLSGYPVWSREEQLKKWNTGEETVASQASLYRWSGCIVPHPRNGNSARTAAAATAATVYLLPPILTETNTGVLFNHGIYEAAATAAAAVATATTRVAAEDD
jgi:hypothetical protein